MPSIEAESSTPGDSRLHVAVALIEDDRGRVLVAWRDQRRHQGGCWEFPGGKVQADETVQEALRRELLEELGIEPVAPVPCLRIPHDYGDRRVLLDVWRVRRFRGEPRGCEGQLIRWVDRSQLRELPFPAANRAIVSAARLPEQYLITPDPGSDRPATDWWRALEQALDQGIRLLQLRAPALAGDPQRLRRLAEGCKRLCQRYQADLLLNGPPELAHDLDLGLHLRSQALATPPFPVRSDGARWLAASCHDATELAAAEALGVDFVVLGPVLPTLTHPGATPLGFARFAELIRDLPLPVFALGGLDARYRLEAEKHRAQGIAAIRGLWPSIV